MIIHNMDWICQIWITIIYLFFFTIMDYEGTRMECSVNLCGWDKKEMTCNGSVILLQNVTNVRSQLTNERAFVDLRRMCSGFRDCSTSNYCRMQKLVRATYLCINENQIQSKCPSYAQVLSSAEGYIQSPDYPSALPLKRCVWRITVPEDSYVTFILHDFQRDVPEHSPCNGGLRIKTDNECPEPGFPSRDICRLRRGPFTFSACGNVEINFIPGDRGYKMRFWLSYKVRKLPILSSSHYDNLPNTSTMCPSGYYDESVYDELLVPQSPGVIHPQYNNSTNSTGLTASIDRNLIMNDDKTEKTVLYVAVAVAIISFTGLIIVTAICIRQRKFKPHSTPTPEHRILPQNGTLSRPLPPVLNRNSIVHERPRLDEGYSIVADEIPYTPTEDNIRSPPYAEVEDHVIDRNHVLRFGRLNSNTNNKKSVENIYSELSDGKDRNVYHEISDETFVHTPSISQNDQTQLINGKRTSKIIPFGSKQFKRPVSFEGPYASSDVTNNRRSGSKDPEGNKRILSKELSGSLSYRSDSDGSLVIENENYEAYQSAHV